MLSLNETVSSNIISLLLHLCKCRSTIDGPPSNAKGNFVNEVYSNLEKGEISKDILDLSGNVLWQAIIQLLQSSPIFQNLKPGYSIESFVIINLPSYTQRLLGALFSTADFIVTSNRKRLDFVTICLMKSLMPSHQPEVLLDILSNYKSLFVYSNIFCKRCRISPNTPLSVWINSSILFPGRAKDIESLSAPAYSDDFQILMNDASNTSDFDDDTTYLFPSMDGNTEKKLDDSPQNQSLLSQQPTSFPSTPDRGGSNFSLPSTINPNTKSSFDLNTKDDIDYEIDLNHLLDTMATDLATVRVSLPFSSQPNTPASTRKPRTATHVTFTPDVYFDRSRLLQIIGGDDNPLPRDYSTLGDDIPTIADSPQDIGSPLNPTSPYNPSTPPLIIHLRPSPFRNDTGLESEQQRTRSPHPSAYEEGWGLSATAGTRLGHEEKYSRTPQGLTTPSAAPLSADTRFYTDESMGKFSTYNPYDTYGRDGFDDGGGGNVIERNLNAENWSGRRVSPNDKRLHDSSLGGKEDDTVDTFATTARRGHIVPSPTRSISISISSTSKYSHASKCLLEGFVQLLGFSGLWHTRYLTLVHQTSEKTPGSVLVNEIRSLEFELRVYQGAVGSAWGMVPVKLKEVIPLSDVESVSALSTKKVEDGTFLLLMRPFTPVSYEIESQIDLDAPYRLEKTIKKIRAPHPEGKLRWISVLNDIITKSYDS